ncbi:MAG: isoprenylcysteine carboxylmethyltransferase family protein [Desulfobulbaceae bacterium]|nr:isoprenylcysteine carboxylmethyltransferase family protein [Desulfobulbaceae bacterium]
MSNLKLKVPPVIQAAICILAMWLLSRYLPLSSFEIVFSPAKATILFTIGGLIAVAGIVSFRQAKTTVDPRTPGTASELVIAGIYNYTRNPMYLGLLIILIGLALLLEAISSFLPIPIFVWCMNRLQIEPEEKALEELFGKSYREYKIKVRRWL